MTKICLIIPAYNEGTMIAQVVHDLSAAMKAGRLQCEIVVVDDGSRDNTAAEASKAGAKVVRHILNTGSGGATATGLSYAQQGGFELAATLDADGQHDPHDVIAGLELMMKGDVDLLIGSRLMNAEGMSNVKILGNKGLSFITSVLFGIQVTDSQSGLRVFSRAALDRLRWKSSGFEFCSEMLWRAKQLGLAISEYPIRAIYTDYSMAKGQNNWNAFNIIGSLLQRRIMELFGE